MIRMKPTLKHRHSLSALALTSLFAFTSPTALSDDIEVYLQEPPDPVPPNILFVVDESGSMRGSRTTQLKAALQTIVADPNMGNVNAAILGYHRNVELTARTGDFKVIGDNQAEFDTQINAIAASGLTPTVPALNAAVNWFRPNVAFTDFVGTSVTSPLEGGNPEDKRCASNHIVLLSDGVPTANNISQFNNADCGPQLISRGRCAAEIATWANSTDLMEGTGWDGVQNINLHTIGYSATTDAETFLQTLATLGGGDYYQSDGGSIVSDLTDIITSAQSNIDYAYNAPAIPFNSDNAAVSGDEIYVPMFLPEDRTFWKGNLKKYTITVTEEDVVLTALNNERVLNEAQEFQSTRDLFCDDDACDPDEGYPLAGGVAQDMTEVRNLYTYLGSDPVLTSAANRVRNSNTAITTSMLGVATDELRTELLNWVTRDPAYVATEDDPSHSGVMGAPIHTQPVVVSYSGGDVVLIPTSEGVLEAIDARLGEELWAFMPQDLLPGINTIKNNDASSIPYYGLDGPMTYYEVGNEKMVIFGMRRGGRKYHIINVTERLAPEYVAEISSDASSHFSKLGQTWSKPLFVKMEIGGTVREVLVFGGGYDPDQDDATPPDPSYSDDEGNAIFIVDAEDGTLLRSISDTGANVNIPEMTFAIPSDLATVDLNGNAVVERIYASDVGGRIIRIDLDDDENDNSNTITGGIIADINDGASVHRKFFNTPQIGYFSKSGIQFLAILIGTGDIANPLGDVTDRFYMIKDTALWYTPDWNTYDAIAHSDFVDASDTAVAGLDPENRGWYIDFSNSEKSFSKAILYDYAIFFTTYSADTVEPDSLCEAVGTIGTGRIYGLNLLTANGAIHWDGSSENPLTISDRSSQLELQGIPPSPQLLFPGGTDDQGNTIIGKKIFLFSDLKKKHEWSDRFRPIYWEEVIDE
ncbi:MAG: VWA domain-containing protein [Candidatus Thiodiazotropha sp. (ex Lucina pensylvanica)]|nr:VWA domain-containing protein [Candidatus Thiodiazotropha sp. (ex Lucina pensylvanica)]MBT3049549.1 VWA domain-containing protein [Candidatus Thiodiazotropha sp. (ex Codakia orbicularis)]